ncbi:MAG: phage integrase N-terminal SAM-like domain-containing protein [Limisphaerales bacterium]
MSPDRITDEQIREYLPHLLHERRLAASTLIVAVSAFRFFFGRVLGRPTESIEKAPPAPRSTGRRIPRDGGKPKRRQNAAS